MTVPDTICMLPWISLEASPQGTAKPCCLYDDEILDDNGNKYMLAEHGLQEIYKSKSMQNLRQDFLNGNKPAGCFRCWNEEDVGRTSKRQFTQIRLKELKNEVDYNNLQPDQLWFLDLKLGNICNLKCRICGSWSSSKWAEEEIKYVKELVTKEQKQTHLAYTFLQQGAWPRKSPLFWENLKQLLPNIKYFEFTGGEPWLIQEHIELLKYAVAQGYSKNIDIHYNTNGTQWPEDLVTIWRDFGRVDIAFSIDNVGDRFEYERYGANWTTANSIIDSVHGMQLLYPNITTQLCFTVNIQNVYYLDELLAWADTKNFGSVYFNLLQSPNHMCISHMTGTAQDLVLTKLKTTFWKSDKYQKEIDSLIRFIESGPGSDGQEFLTKMKITDEYRKQSFKDTHSDIAIAMGYE
jgi:sulfatase maturation enzyme AslB (radical SAM superfamily)